MPSNAHTREKIPDSAPRLSIPGILIGEPWRLGPRRGLQLGRQCQEAVPSGDRCRGPMTKARFPANWYRAQLGWCPEPAGDGDTRHYHDAMANAVRHAAAHSATTAELGGGREAHGKRDAKNGKFFHSEKPFDVAGIKTNGESITALEAMRHPESAMAT